MVQLFFALGQGVRSVTAPAAAFVLAQLLQPSISAMLMGDSAAVGQVLAAGTSKGRCEFMHHVMTLRCSDARIGNVQA